MVTTYAARLQECVVEFSAWEFAARTRRDSLNDCAERIVLRAALVESVKAIRIKAAGAAAGVRGANVKEGATGGKLPIPKYIWMRDDNGQLCYSFAWGLFGMEVV